MRRRPPGLSVGLAASLRSMPTASCEAYQTPSAGADACESSYAAGFLQGESRFLPVHKHAGLPWENPACGGVLGVCFLTKRDGRRGRDVVEYQAAGGGVVVSSGSPGRRA